MTPADIELLVGIVFGFPLGILGGVWMSEIANKARWK